MRVLAAALLAASMAGSVVAQESKAGDLSIRGAVMRAVPPGVPNSAGYMVIANTGTKEDRLMSATCACARAVEIHVSHVMNGTAMMMPASALPIPAGGQIAFGPGGYHLMILGLKAPLQDGAVQSLTLKFQHAGAVVAPFQVKARIPLQPARAQ